MQLPIWNTPSGSIGEIQEGNPFSFQLDYTNPLFGALTPMIISGSLPDGIVLHDTGIISGTSLNIDVTNTFSFTIRLTNEDGSSDRTFDIIIDDIEPQWLDPTDLGTKRIYSLFDYQFTINDPGGINHTFTKISGTLPPGLSLTNSGRLYGIITSVLVDSEYNFTLRVKLDDDKIIDKDFTINVTKTGNRTPLWNDPSGLIGNISYGIPFSFQFSAGDPDNNTVIFSGTGLPPGFTLTTSGLFSGTLTATTPELYSFDVSVTDGFISVSRSFKVNANHEVLYPITWITNSGLLGSIKEGDKSLLSVRAESESRWIRYEIVSGDLPEGLTLDINTGDIFGIALEQLSVDHTFEFTIRAYNVNSEAIQSFSINLLDYYTSGATRIYATLYGDDRLLFDDLFTTTDIKNGDIFREADAQYGLINKPKIIFVENLDNPSPDDIYGVIEGVRRTYLTLGKVEVAKAVYNDSFSYEILYRKIYDDSQGADLEVTFPQTSIVQKPGSLGNIRTRLLQLGFSGGSENLPLFLNSEQIIGDDTTILGWFPYIAFAYVNSGSGQSIADKINSSDEQGKKLYSRRVRIDRFIMEPAADDSFDPQFILFDSEF